MHPARAERHCGATCTDQSPGLGAGASRAPSAAAGAFSPLGGGRWSDPDGPARSLRDQFPRAMGATIVDIAEMDLALAHLRIPETV
jgi:hypothetical protein